MRTPQIQTLRIVIGAKVPLVTSVRTVRVAVTKHFQRPALQGAAAGCLVPRTRHIFLALAGVFVRLVAAIGFAVALPRRWDALTGEGALELLRAASSLVVAEELVGAVLAVAVGIAAPVQGDAGPVIAAELGAFASFCKEEHESSLRK